MNSLRSDFDALYLGALLHDVGKFWQRSEKQNQFTKHPTLSSAFVEQLFQDERISAITAFHHAQDLRQSNLPTQVYRLARMVGEADSLASREREERATQRSPQQLHSIFSQIKGHHTIYYQPTCSLNPGSYQFVQKDSQSEYQEAQWKQFTDEANAIIENLPEKQWGDALLMLSKKYLWCIPSAYYQSVPDISLYEHSRLTAAIACCLYKSVSYHKDDALITDPSHPHYFLVCGDLTGIQKFIYNIGHKNAVKALKGRSFALQHLTEVLGRQLLKAFELPLANLIYANGGKFYALLPNTPDLEKHLGSFQYDIDHKFLDNDTFQGEIGLILAGIPLSGNDFKHISEKWEEVHQQLEQKKKTRYASHFENLFSPFGPSGAVVECVATKRDLCRKEDTKDYLAKELIFKIEQDDDDPMGTDLYQSSEQYHSSELGKRLKNVKTLTPLVLTYSSTDNRLPSSIPIGKIADVSISQNGVQNVRDIQFAQVLNDDDFLRYTQNTLVSWKFYGGNWQTEEFDRVKIWTGIDRLGVLRMDVDNLGNTFKDGFGDKASFSRITQLSTMLDFFFCGYINNLHDKFWHPLGGVMNDCPPGMDLSSPGKNEDNRTVYHLRDLMQIVYAGGDDLFIVGHWAVLPDVAIWIRDEFDRFTGYHPKLTISGGISIFRNKYPIYKAAKDAGNAEHDAKKKRKGRNGEEKEKDAINFLDTVMSWEDFKEVRNYVRMFYKISPQKNARITDVEIPAQLAQIRLDLGIKRGFFQRLHRIHDEYVVGEEKRWATWCWRAFYSLSRYMEQQSDQAKKHVIQLRDALATDIPHTEQDMIKLLYPIARWAELLTRNAEGEKA